MEELFAYSTASTERQTLRCHLIATTTSAEEENLRTAYSLLVVMEDGGQEIDSHFLSDVTRDRSTAEMLVDVFTRRWILPDELAEAVENLLYALEKIRN